jgi:Tfp pilus assembly protein PilV
VVDELSPMGVAGVDVRPGGRARPIALDARVKLATPGPIKSGMTTWPRAIPSRLAGEDGFTIVEGVVASLVLVIGLLGVLTMLTGSLRATTASNARVTATNVTRELIEAVRGLSYSDMTGSLVTTRLQAQGLGSGTPWTITRRGVTFTLSATSCTFDDPADKLAATPPADVCTPAPSGTTGDPNGEDFRRTTFTIDWNEPGGRPRTFTQSTLVVNPTGGLGPRIVSFTPVTQTITSNGTTSATVAWTTTPAQTLQWTIDDGQTTGSAPGTTSFPTTWDIGTSGTGSETLDGSYQMTAQPFDDRGVAGEAKRANIVLNRRQPYPPPTLEGGHNTRLGDWVELQWTPNNERDILGYKAVWAGLDQIPGTFDDLQICPLLSEGTMLPPTTTACTDLAPPIGATKYFVVAVDRNRDGVVRDGDRRVLAIAAPTARPTPPRGPFTTTTVNGVPKLTWTAPVNGTVNFYRIYRDGSRYDRTTTATTTFTDASAGTSAHLYWVTAVDPTFNESDALGPVIWWG